ncbi:MAG: DUF899 domain-containing protein [Ilumatobacter sp.]|nr:DUF899 domain-containing protein [Ilumatobacter sp.]
MPNITSRADWEAARLDLMAAEKEHTRLGDELARRRRDLPWVRVETRYTFDTEDGPRTLADLFDDRGQLIVWHFMFGDDWDEGCPSCSFWADGYSGMEPHLAARDVTLVAVSTAPLDRLLAYRDRMGWSFPWVSSGGTTFNRDFEVAGADRYNYQPMDEPIGELPGFSVFALHDGDVYHTYSRYSRGLDIFNNAYQMLDMVPKGRDEDDLPWSMAWLRRHDQYDT